MTEGVRWFHDRGIEAALFDLDGVITKTAKVHAVAWKQLFDRFLAEREGRDTASEPFRIPEDYVSYVDGKPRYDGIKSFLYSRSISLPWGTADDLPDQITVCGLGNRKNGYFNAALEKDGVEVFPSTIDLVRALSDEGIPSACVSSSKNCRPVLERARLTALFGAIFDGEDLYRQGLSGKPAPDMFLKAADMLGVACSKAVVVEDAVSGVQAGRAGGFAEVIGIDRGAGRKALAEAGATVVVNDLSDL